MAKKLGAPKKYDAEQLARAVAKYFRTITREIEVTEDVWTGELDDHGHKIYEKRPVLNSLGRPFVKTEYLEPPTVSGICNFLNIHRSTWDEYCDPVKNPDFSDTTTYARGRMLAWREEQLLTREKTKGLEFDLQNNWGWKTTIQAEVGGSLESYLQQLADQGDGGQSF